MLDHQITRTGEVVPTPIMEHILRPVTIIGGVMAKVTIMEESLAQRVTPMEELDLLVTRMVEVETKAIITLVDALSKTVIILMMEMLHRLVTTIVDVAPSCPQVCLYHVLQ
jgi:hypothetical protein